MHKKLPSFTHDNTKLEIIQIYQGGPEGQLQHVTSFVKSWNTTTSIHLPIVYGCFHDAMSELNICKKKKKIIWSITPKMLSGHLQKKFTNSWSTVYQLKCFEGYIHTVEYPSAMKINKLLLSIIDKPHSHNNKLKKKETNNP